MTPQEEIHALQRRVKRTAKNDPDLAVASLMARFKVSRKLMLELLGDEPAIAPEYRRRARYIKRPLDEVVMNREAGQEWCRICEDWFPSQQYFIANTGSKKHNVGICKRGKGNATALEGKKAQKKGQQLSAQAARA